MASSSASQWGCGSSPNSARIGGHLGPCAPATPSLPVYSCPDDPLSICLVGILFKPSEYPKSLLEVQIKSNLEKPPFKVVYRGGSTYKLQLLVTDPLVLWSDWVETLPRLEKEPQELEILG